MHNRVRPWAVVARLLHLAAASSWRTTRRTADWWYWGGIVGGVYNLGSCVASDTQQPLKKEHRRTPHNDRLRWQSKFQFMCQESCCLPRLHFQTPILKVSNSKRIQLETRSVRPIVPTEARMRYAAGTGWFCLLAPMLAYL